MRAFVTVLLAGLWIGASEFLRNQVLINSVWVSHFRALGLEFPSAPLNAAVWILWGFVFATIIYVISRRFTLLETTLISWTVGFLMMWLVTWNLAVLPLSILLYAVPLSALEAFVASLICLKLSPVPTDR